MYRRRPLHSGPILLGGLLGLLLLRGVSGADCFPCSPGQALSTNSGGQLICKRLPVGDAYLQQCGPGEALTSNGVGLSCTAAARPSLLQQIQDLDTKSQQLLARINALPPPAPRGVYVGVTAATTTGRMQQAGRPDGLLAANARCGASYAGAHLCSAYEMYRSVRLGTLTVAGTVPKSWIYMPAGKRPDPLSAMPEDGLADNCGGYTYAGALGAGNRWSGTAVEWTTLPTGSVGFFFHGGSSAPCDAALPLACCR